MYTYTDIYMVYLNTAHTVLAYISWNNLLLFCSATPTLISDPTENDNKRQDGVL